MKKWEIGVLIGFFAVFVILFFSVEQPWQPKTSKVGEPIIIDDVHLDVDSILVDDHLDIRFEDRNGKTVGYKKYEADAGWKFIIFDLFIYVSKDANGARTFFAGRIEDEDGMVYYDYLLEYLFLPGETSYLDLFQYKDNIELPPGEGDFISVAYKMPTNAVPEKSHYSIDNSKTWYGEVLLKK
jgi:hypothetical protein